MSSFYSHRLEEGIRLLYFQTDESKYPEGVRLLEQAVENGEPDAYYFLARCYVWEDGNVKENMQLARELSRKGIAKGSHLCVLGADRFNGLTGELQEAMEAMQCTLADAFNGVINQAKAGNPMAQFAVGLFYYWQDISTLQQPANQAEYDENEKKNTIQSLKWFKMAAEQGCIPAFRLHYTCLANGTNGATRDVKAAMRFVESVKHKLDIPLHFYREFVEQYEALGQPMDQLRWLEAGVEKGDCTCINGLGVAYLNGVGVQEDKVKAAKLFSQAAKLDDENGLYNLGRCCLNGWGMKEDHLRAFRCFQEAAARGVSGAQWLLATCYKKGYGTPVDLKECFIWVNRAAKNGNPQALHFLGKCYLYGDGVTQDTDRAKEYLEESALSGLADALFLLGKIYDQALGVPEDIARGVNYYQRAAEAGSKEAKEALNGFKKGLLAGKWKRK